jgi:mRNA-degrading endonuclease toxin of MazEF toxin-antitoxin module
VIISNDVSNAVPLLVVVVPAIDVSELSAVLGVRVPGTVSGFSADISVLSNQPRTLDPGRFTTGPVGTVPAELMLKISFALKVRLDLFDAPLPRS